MSIVPRDPNLNPLPEGVSKERSGKMPRPVRSHKCGRCDARWYGANIAHCAACHRTFSGPVLFDAHRAGSKNHMFTQGECSNPADRGMVQNAHGNWGMPNDGTYDFKARRNGS